MAVLAFILMAALGVCTVLCFVQAARIQKRWAIDGVVRDGAKFSAMRLWVIVGTAFGCATFALLMAIVNPPPVSAGRP